MKKNASETHTLMLALVMALVIMVGWQYFVELPRKKLQLKALHQQTKVEQQIEQKKASIPLHSRDELLGESPRLRIASKTLEGTIALKGLRLDDLTLTQFRETISPDSARVKLFSPAYDADGYFAEFGWLAPTGATLTLPDKNSLWAADKQELTPTSPVTLTWRNPEGITFTTQLTLDEQYMFTVSQSATDASGKPVALQYYAYVNRVHDVKKQQIILVHEGPISVYDGILKYTNFKDIADGKSQTTDTASGGWVGMSDKYWLSAIIPPQQQFSSRVFSYVSEDGRERFQSDYSTSTPQAENKILFFAGAKDLDALDAYTERFHIPLFYRAVDFGKYFYFLSKPMYFLLEFFHSIVGNFGIAILLLTVVVKLIMYPMADKSYKSMAQMSIIRPKILELQERFKDDKLKLNQEMIELYKREKVNPASGCLPALIQIPVFIALYNVLYVTLALRQAPFYGWIHDLSVPDPSNVFTLFGLLHWAPPAILHVGAWPLMMAITMFIQQSQSPPPPDPTQAAMMKYLPLLFLFMFSSVASGLVIYWTWSNLLSILQQWHIKRRHGHIKR